MNAERNTFTLATRVPHWLMAVLILAMLFIGMVASVSERHGCLLRIHKPLGMWLRNYRASALPSHAAII